MKLDLVRIRLIRRTLQIGNESELRGFMDIVEESDCVLTIELVINIDYEHMTTAILDYFTPDNKSEDEITSWYVGFEFYIGNLSVFYFNHYDVGNDRHCFEIREKNADRRTYFKKKIEKFEQFLKMQAK